jgi:hypothetical protein
VKTTKEANLRQLETGVRITEMPGAQVNRLAFFAIDVTGQVLRRKQLIA